jgi:hypothetical protein
MEAAKAQNWAVEPQEEEIYHQTATVHMSIFDFLLGVWIAQSVQRRARRSGFESLQKVRSLSYTQLPEGLWSVFKLSYGYRGRLSRS